jgi:hypothetical protein
MRKWCERCNKYHNAESVDPEKIARDHAQELADEIDRMVMEKIKNEKQDRVR